MCHHLQKNKPPHRQDDKTTSWLHKSPWSVAFHHTSVCRWWFPSPIHLLKHIERQISFEFVPKRLQIRTNLWRTTFMRNKSIPNLPRARISFPLPLLSVFRLYSSCHLNDGLNTWSSFLSFSSSFVLFCNIYHFITHHLNHVPRVNC